MKHLISVLVPAYNAEKWITDTIESVLCQDWARKELIIVNDGSTDNTLSIAKSFKSNFVKVVDTKNGGASAARNRALSLAQGDYIQWLDADDLLAPNKLSQQLRRAEDDTTSRILLSSAFGEFTVRPRRAKFIQTGLWQDLAPVDFLLKRFTQNLWMNPAVWLVSRKLTELAGPWDERLSLDDDGEYFSRVIAACDGVWFVPEARVYYRRGNVGSLSRSTSDRACESLLLSLRLCINHLRSLEDSHRTRAASLQLLQTWVGCGDYFAPDRKDLLTQIEKLAQELGGILRPAKLPWKYRPMQALFGWNVARRMRTLVSNTKHMARVYGDYLSVFPVKQDVGGGKENVENGRLPVARRRETPRKE